MTTPHDPNAFLLAAYEAALHIGAELDIDLVLQRVVDLARTVVPSKYAALGVCNDEGVIQQFITSGVDAETRAAIGALPHGDGLLGVLIHEGCPLIVPDIASDPRSVGFPPNHPPMQSMLGVPIVLGERTLGDLYLTERAGGPYTTADLEVVQVLAAHAARAIERAQLYSAVERGQQTAEEQRDQLQAILDNLPSGILIYALPDMRVEMSNQTARAFVRGDEPAGVPQYALPYRLLTLEGEPLETESYPSRRALRGETIRNAQVIMERLDGTRFPIFVQAAPLYDAKGKIAQAVVVFQDITRLREAEQLKDDFLSLLSHEFRTPLTAINGGARLLASAGDAIDSETRAELLNDIVTESKKLEQMLSNMLSMAAIMAGRLTPLAEPVLIEPIVRRVSAEVAAIAPNHRFVNQIPHGLPAAEGDAELLSQVMRNLYENAVKYSPQGGTVLTTADADVDGNWVRVHVHDNGIGIAAHAVPDLFQRFRRAGADPTIRGMGLGLYLSRMLVEAQGGAISASSAGPGKGATFTIALPVIRESVEEHA